MKPFEVCKKILKFRYIRNLKKVKGFQGFLKRMTFFVEPFDASKRFLKLSEIFERFLKTWEVCGRFLKLVETYETFVSKISRS